jgi:hypothetical protein
MPNKKSAFTVILLLFLAIMPMLITDLTSAESSEYVKIKVDGSVEPSSAPIQKNGDLYTLTGDIMQYLVVERNYTTVDGGGHRVGGIYGPLLVQSGYSYTVDGVTNVAITNFVIDGSGIVFFSAVNSVLSHIIINNGTGIDISGDGNVISDTFVNYGRGLGVSGKNNLVASNHLTSVNYTFVENNPPPYGIYIGGSGNTVMGNWIVGTKGIGIDLGTSTFNVIYGNQIWENTIGIQTTTIYSQGKAENNTIYFNNFVSNQQHYFDEMIMTAPHSTTNWDFGTMGNYWGDYRCADANGDGKGDTAYIIDAINQDHYPLINPVNLNSLPPLVTPSPTPAATTAPTIALSPTSSPGNPTPSPTVPELPIAVVLPLLLSLAFVAFLLRRIRIVRNQKSYLLTFKL